MEIQYNLHEVFGQSQQIYALANTKNINHLLAPKFLDIRSIQPLPLIQQIINNLGRASASAQSIKQPITTYDKLIFSLDRIYIAVEQPHKVVGFLRVGPKTLFYFHPQGETLKLDNCLSVLDFYVVEQEQRRGYGKMLFDTFLRTEGVQPHQLAYDRPSNKMLNFLRKYYGLKDYISQNNSFVIFNNYFTSQPGVPIPSQPQEVKAVQKMRRSDLAREEERLYQSAERDLMNKRNSLNSIADFQSSQNQSREQYQQDFKNRQIQSQNSMVSSAKTNLIFRSIQKLSLDKSSPIGFGYARPSLGPRVNPATFKINRNEIEIQQVQDRMHNADDELERLKLQIQELESNVKPTVNMPALRTSSDYGRFIRRR